MSDQMNGLSNHALQNVPSNQASYSSSINNDLKKRAALFMCGECLQLFLDLDEGTQHWRKCKSNSKTGDLCLTSGTLELSIDVVRYLVDSEASSLIPNEKSSENQQSTDSMNEPATPRSIENRSPVKPNHQQSIGDNAHSILEQTGLNRLADDQSITAVNETSVQKHSGPVVKDNQQSTDSINESVIPRSIPNQSPVESNLQQSTGDNADLILEQIGLNGLFDDQSITAVNETSIQNHYESEVKENSFNANLEEVDTSSNHLNERLYKCKECIKCFPNLSIRNRHIILDSNLEEVGTKTSNNHHNEKPYKCEKCIKCFSNVSKRNRHFKSVHRDFGKFKCEECPKSFAQKTTLNTHIKSVHRKIRPFKCEECIKFFKLKSYLNRHTQAVHRGIRPFKCEECIKSFTEKSALNRHTQSVHRGIRPFKCEECPKSFTQKISLNMHIKSVHRKIRPFKCEECLKSFVRKEDRHKHIQRVHRGIRPCKCKECAIIQYSSQLDSGLVNDQLITAINETSIQSHSWSEVKENQQSTDSMNVSNIPRNIVSNNQQTIGNNAHPILEQTGLNGLVDNQSIISC